MGNRFKDLKRAAKLAGGNGAGGSALDKFNQWRTGGRAINYIRSQNSNPGGLEPITLAPFGAPVNDTYITNISKRAKAMISSLGGSAKYNHQTAAATDKVNPGYVPAKATVQTSSTGTTSTVSKITGISYKKEVGAASYTIPFGGDKTAAGKIFLTVTGAILTAVKAESAENSVSFQPERWRL